MAAEPAVGVWGHMPRLDATIRIGMHAVVVGRVLATRKRAERRQLALAAVATALYDAWRVSHRSDPNTTSAVALGGDALVTAAWAMVVDPDPVHLRPAVMATGFPNALGEGFLLTAGQRGVPVVAGARAWPPADFDDGLRRLGRLVCVAAGPTFAAGIARLARGRAPGFATVVWPSVAAAMGVGLARVRAHQQAEITLLWQDRTAAEIERARAQARYEAVSAGGARHDLGKVMWCIAIGADGTLLDRAKERLAAPNEATPSDTDGWVPVGRAVPGVPVSPPTAVAWWVTQAQARAIADLVDQVLDRLDHTSDDPAPVLHLQRAGGGLLTARYAHRRLELWTQRPALMSWRDVRMALDPVSVGLAVMGLVKTCGFLRPLGSAPPGVAAVAGAAEIVAGAVLVARYPSAERNPQAAILASGLGCAVWQFAVAAGWMAETTSQGDAVYPATLATSVLGPIGHYARDLPRPQVLVGIGSVLLSWSLAMRRRSQPASRPEWWGELSIAGQYLMAAWGFAHRAGTERAVLDASLERLLDARMAFVTARVRLDEHAHARADVELARAVLAAPGAHGELSGEDLAALDRQLDAIVLQLAADEQDDRVALEVASRHLASASVAAREAAEPIAGLPRSARVPASEVER